MKNFLTKGKFFCGLLFAKVKGKTKEFKKILFFLVAFAVAADVVITAPFHLSIFLTGIVMACILSWKFEESSSHPLEDKWLSRVWALLCFAIYVSVASLYAPVSDNDIHFYCVSILIGGFLCSLIYVFVPWISNFMGFSEQTGFNNPAWVIVLSVVLSAGAFWEEMYHENDAREEIEWKKLEFQAIASYTIEVWPERGTVYIIKTQAGPTFYVHPYDVPEVRNINPDSKVKFKLASPVESYGGARRTERVEFKN